MGHGLEYCGGAAGEAGGSHRNPDDLIRKSGIKKRTHIHKMYEVLPINIFSSARDIHPTERLTRNYCFSDYLLQLTECF